MSIANDGGYTIPAQFLRELTDPFHFAKYGWFRWEVFMSAVYDDSPEISPLFVFWRKSKAKATAARMNQFIRNNAEKLAKVCRGKYAEAFAEDSDEPAQP